MIVSTSFCLIPVFSARRTTDWLGVKKKAQGLLGDLDSTRSAYSDRGRLLLVKPSSSARTGVALPPG